MTEQEEKLKQKINSGQSLKMICWEFKMNKSSVISFAKKNNLILRTKDDLRFSSKLNKRNRSRI
jgi:hypothetical protein